MGSLSVGSKGIRSQGVQGTGNDTLMVITGETGAYGTISFRASILTGFDTNVRIIL